MMRLTLIFCVVTSMVLSTALVHHGGGSDNLLANRRRDMDGERASYCYSLIDTNEQCSLSTLPTLGILIDKEDPSAWSQFLDAVRAVGFHSICQEVGGAFRCVISMMEDALDTCPDVFEEKFTTDKSIPIMNELESFAGELCSARNPYGIDVSDHLECFTDYDLVKNIAACYRVHSPDRTPDGFISCVVRKMEKDFPDVCNNQSRRLFDLVIRRLDKKLTQFITEGEDFMKRIKKVF